MHNPAEFIPERFDPVRFYGTITYTRPETHGEIHEMKHNTSDSLEEETYATCFTDLPFHFSSIIFNYHIVNQYLINSSDISSNFTLYRKFSDNGMM